MHERISVNNLCFPMAGFADQATIWSDLGARRVSLMGPPLFTEGVLESAKAALDTGNYAVETIVHGPLVQGHLTLQEDGWQEGRERLSRIIRAANDVGAQSIYLLTGGHGSLVWEDAAERFGKAIAPSIAEAQEAGVRLLIENSVSLYADLHIAHSLTDLIAVAEIAGVGVCIDIFGCWGEAGLRQSIERAMPHCHLIQVSDYVYGDRAVPSRAVPGDGIIPLKRILDWALSAGYAGAFDLELIGPRIDKEGHVEAVRRTCVNLSEILHSLGA